MPVEMTVSATRGATKLVRSETELQEEKRAAMICSPRQARLAMAQTPYEQGDLLSAVQAAVTANPNPAVKIAWEYATEWQRTDVFISSIGAQLGLTEEDIDDLFLLAMQL